VSAATAQPIAVVAAVALVVAAYQAAPSVDRDARAKLKFASVKSNAQPFSLATLFYPMCPRFYLDKGREHWVNKSRATWRAKLTALGHFPAALGFNQCLTS